MFDLELIEKYYSTLEKKISDISNYLDRPLTLSEKILYSHSASNLQNFV